MKFNKQQLDKWATLLGAIVGTSTVLLTYDVGDRKVVGVIGGLAAAAHGWISQRPASAHPTTEEIEDQEAS